MTSDDDPARAKGPGKPSSRRPGLPDGERCTRVTAKGRRCPSPREEGTDLCAIHGRPAGGRSRGHVQTVEAEKAEVRRRLKDFPAAEFDDADPIVVLRRVMAEASAFAAAARAAVEELDPDNWAVWGETGPTVRVQVALYERSIERVAKVAASLASLDLDRLALMLEHARAAELAAALGTALEEASVAPETALTVVRAFRRQLAAIPIGR